MQKTLSATIHLILADAYSFFAQHFVQIAALCLPFLLATTALDFILSDLYRASSMALVAPLMINLAVYPIYTAALIHLMSRRARQEQPRNGDLIMVAVRQWASLFTLKVIMVFLVGLGISLLIVPGIWLGVRLVFAEFHLVLFGMTPRDAIMRSFADTKDHFALILILMAATYVPIFLLGLTTDQLLQAYNNDFYRIVVNTAWSVLGLLVHVVLFRAFMQVLSEQNMQGAS